MSLITNEIYVLDGFRKTILVFAADRRISNLDGSHVGNHPKLFRIPYFDGGISYFGLAEAKWSKRQVRLWEFLPAFIRKNSDASDVGEFARRLQMELNALLPPSLLQSTPSGFHICGYSPEGLPDFWSLMNMGGMDQFAYTKLQARYSVPNRDFLERDAITLGWDGSDLRSVRNEGWIYRNGDFRAHVVAWQRLDQVLTDLTGFHDFRPLRTTADLERWVKFKMEFIGKLYRQFSKKQIIGGTIDVFCTSRNFK